MSRPPEDEFYIGYMPKAPRGQGRFNTAAALFLLLLLPLLGMWIAKSQKPFGPGTFEYGTVRRFEGRIVEEPFPMIRVERPFTSAETVDEATRYSLYSLVLFGKHSAAELIKGLQGQKVTLRGTLIYRDDQVMVEVVADSLQILEQGTTPGPEPIGLKNNEVVLIGEIVDSKCFLGVMKPANFKTHKACAIRCISGGIPPLLVVRDGRDTPRYFLLASADGQSINKQLLPLVAEPVQVTGRVFTSDNINLLYANPEDYELLADIKPLPVD